jgi:hypothetical protein
MGVWNVFLSSILVPLVAIALLARSRRRPLSGWLTTLFMAAGLTGFSFFVASSGTFGVPMRWLIGGLFLAAAAFSWFRRPAVETEARPDSGARLLVKVLIGFFFGGVAAGAIAGRSEPAGAVDVGFPLRGGTFLVLHGGSTPPSNVYAREEKQRYAVDLVALNSLGMRAKGFAPEQPSAYAVYGAEVVSPCDGAISSVSDGAPDVLPAAASQTGPAPDPLGNQVVVACEDRTAITLSQLQKGSIAVRPGQRVERGARLARVGNSGASPEPHLHVHAERDGKAEPLTFDGRWLVRNATVKR